jgi:hypothetical protein
MQKIRMTLWRHDKDDWSIEVHGKLHRHVSLVVVDELAEYALVAAQDALEQCGPAAPTLIAVDGLVH